MKVILLLLVLPMLVTLLLLIRMGRDECGPPQDWPRSDWWAILIVSVWWPLGFAIAAQYYWDTKVKKFWNRLIKER